MNYADKIMNTEYYQKLKREGTRLLKSILPTLMNKIPKNIPMKYLDLFYEFSLKVKPLRIRYRGKSKTVMIDLLLSATKIQQTLSPFITNVFDNQIIHLHNYKICSSQRLGQRL